MSVHGGKRFFVKSPHGEWDVIVSMYAADHLTAAAFTQHALHNLVPSSQQKFRWYLTENGRRIPDDEQLHPDRERHFNLVMEMP